MSENFYYFRCNGEDKMLVIKDDEVNDAFKKIQQENYKLNKVIDEMSKFMSYDYCIPTVREECKIGEATPEKCVDCIRQFFIKKVKEQENEKNSIK